MGQSLQWRWEGKDMEKKKTLTADFVVILKLYDTFAHSTQKIYKSLRKKQQRHNEHVQRCCAEWKPGSSYTYSRGKPGSPGLPNTMSGSHPCLDPRFWGPKSSPGLVLTFPGKICAPGRQGGPKNMN